ncbi:hypothetical protein FACS189426_11700 [Bacteroidia bacterium]|nr:hypothetical protein FACS189426_11700 [Bacteroidia bacterium]
MCIDWSQFLPSMIATFIGFVLALIGQWFFGYIKKSKGSGELKSHIAEELNSIKLALENFESTFLDVQPLKTPIWNALINAGQVALLDTQIREQLFGVYSTIQEFNSWSLVQTNYYFENERYNELLTNELTKLKTELINNEKSSFSRSIILLLDKL